MTLNPNRKKNILLGDGFVASFNHGFCCFRCIAGPSVVVDPLLRLHEPSPPLQDSYSEEVAVPAEWLESQLLELEIGL